MREREVPWGRHALLAALFVTCAGCATSGSDIHLEPLWSRTNTADEAVEIEALGGFYLRREDAAGEELEFKRYGPLFGYSPGAPNGDPDVPGYDSHFLVPFGFASRTGSEKKLALLPIFTSGTRLELDGSPTFQLLALPGLFIERNPNTGTQFALFPIWGRFRNYLTYDRLNFVLWPLFVYAEREERATYHFLWPVFGWTTGGGEESFHLWPLYGRRVWEGRFDRRYYLWPFIHYNRNFLGGGGEEPETTFLFWPFYGRNARGTYRAHTVLWPFFGYSYDPRSDFWALDAPWPFVRFQRGPGDVHRSRVWPLYSYTRADGLEATSFLWPVVQLRHEQSADYERDSTWVIPFWQRADRTDLVSGREDAWRKLWPIYQWEGTAGWERGSFPTLDPFWQNELIDRHYGWIWKLWEWEIGDGYRRERSWLGLWRRERGRGEDRRSFSALWASRKYADEAGAGVEETSLLFGLLRWRVKAGDGFAMLRPAFPGPGWPAQGVR